MWGFWSVPFFGVRSDGSIGFPFLFLFLFLEGQVCREWRRSRGADSIWWVGGLSAAHVRRLSEKRRERSQVSFPGLLRSMVSCSLAEDSVWTDRNCLTLPSSFWTTLKSPRIGGLCLVGIDFILFFSFVSETTSRSLPGFWGVAYGNHWAEQKSMHDQRHLVSGRKHFAPDFSFGRCKRDEMVWERGLKVCKH